MAKPMETRLTISCLQCDLSVELSFPEYNQALDEQ